MENVPGFMPNPGHFHLLIGVTGSVAAIKTAEILEGVRKISPQIDTIVVPTERACNFLDLPSLLQVTSVFTDKDEWSMWKDRGDPVLHIELRKWADMFLIAPLAANTLGKLANGLCDNLLTCVARAWDISQGPLYFCPAMNTLMYSHPLTSRHIDTLTQTLRYSQIDTVSKTLMCGDTGIGAMASVDSILSAVKKEFEIWLSKSTN